MTSLLFPSFSEVMPAYARHFQIIAQKFRQIRHDNAVSKVVAQARLLEVPQKILEVVR